MDTMPILHIRRSLLILFFYLSTLAAITKSRQQDSYYFDPAPIDQDVVEGAEAYLRCDVSNRKHIKFYWSLNNKRLANTSRRYQEDSNLRILRADRQLDSGSFRCIATNATTGVSLSSTEAQLNILCKYHLLNLFSILEISSSHDFDLSLCCCFIPDIFRRGVLDKRQGARIIISRNARSELCA